MIQSLPVLTSVALTHCLDSKERIEDGFDECMTGHRGYQIVVVRIRKLFLKDLIGLIVVKQPRLLHLKLLFGIRRLRWLVL